MHDEDGRLNSQGKVDVPKARSLESCHPASGQEMNQVYDTAVGRAIITAARQQLQRLEDVDLAELCRDLKLNTDEKQILIARSQGNIKKRDAETAWRTLARK